MRDKGCSKEHLLYLKRQKKRLVTVWCFRILLLITFFSLWELFAALGIIDSFISSSPSRMLKTLKNLYSSGDLFKHIGTTLYETLLGFVIATVTGSIVALLFWWFSTLRSILEPYVVILNSLPKIALGPIIIIWFGAGVKAIVFMTFLITVIVTVITMLNGFLATENEKILLLHTMGANKLQILSRLVIPSSLPTFISMLKINIGMSWIGSIMGEYLVSKAGIGYLIVYGGQVFKLDLVMTSTLILCALAGGMYALVALIEKLTVRK